MSARDNLKPIGTLTRKTVLTGTDKVIVYPNDLPVAPVGAQYTDLDALDTKLTSDVSASISTLTTAVNAIHPDLHLSSTLFASGTAISAGTKKILTVPAGMVDYRITGLNLRTYANAAATVTCKVTVHRGAQDIDATVPVSIASGAYSASGGPPVAGHVKLASGDEVRIVISAGSDDDGLDAVIDLSWFSSYTPTDVT